MSRAGTYKISAQTGWKNCGNITSQEAALGVDERDNASVEALSATKKIKIDIPTGAYAALLRFRADGGNNIDSVVELYNQWGTDHYHLLAQLTIVEGQQDTDDSTIHFIDTITPGSEDSLFDGEEPSAMTTDDIAHYYVRTLGSSNFLLMCSDLDSTTVYLDVLWLYE